MSNCCRICERRIPRWNNSRFNDAPPVEGFWSGFCLVCRIQCRNGLRYYFSAIPGSRIFRLPLQLCGLLKPVIFWPLFASRLGHWQFCNVNPTGKPGFHLPNCLDAYGGYYDYDYD